jgi:hypothetical protein
VVFSDKTRLETTVEIRAERVVRIRPLMIKRPMVTATNLPANMDDRVLINTTIKLRFSKPGKGTITVLNTTRSILIWILRIQLLPVF